MKRQLTHGVVQCLNHSIVLEAKPLTKIQIELKFYSSFTFTYAFEALSLLEALLHSGAEDIWSCGRLSFKLALFDGFPILPPIET